MNVDLGWPAAIAIGFVGGLGLLALAVGVGALLNWLF